MAWLDGEMSDEEAADFERLLEQHPEWREEVEEMTSLVHSLDELKFKPPDSRLWDGYWEEIDSRLGEKKLGWVLMAIGGAALCAIGIFKVLTFSENPWVRTGLGLTIGGFVLLFFSVLRGHLLERPKDRYRKIRK